MAILKLALAQHDFTVGAVDANAARAAGLALEAKASGADLLVLPELALCGYPPDDLLRRPSFIEACESALAELAVCAAGIDLLVGHPARAGAVAHTPDEHAFQSPLLNALSLLRDGAVHARYAKHALPNYGVFDEKRYFTPGTDPKVVEIAGVRVGLLICEDVWIDAPVDAACAAGARLLIVPNASPYDMDKAGERLAVLQHQAQRHGVAIAYLNGVGGQDDVLFDGSSLLINADGSVAARARAFEEALLHASFDAHTGAFSVPDWPAASLDADEVLHAGLVCGIRDYVTKNGFPGVLLGLSGGLDSALTLALAVDALGPDRVTAVMLPSRYTSSLSLDGARAQARALGVPYEVVQIEPAFEAMLGVLEPVFAGKPADLTEENLQSRIRGALLMALSNKHGRLLLATGNKSEMAVGYATLYGDMCGAYAPLKDVYKTRVYALARWCNAHAAGRGGSEVIPQAVIDRPPSAELRHDQTDQDSLPDYPTLDAILERFIEREQSRAKIIEAGFDADTVNKVATLVLRNEFKRRQSAPGPKVTPRAFGRERRYPITSGWT